MMTDPSQLPCPLRINQRDKWCDRSGCRWWVREAGMCAVELIGRHCAESTATHDDIGPCEEGE